MENKIYNDDVERIVNDPERQEAINAFHEKRYAKRQRKMLVDAIVCASASLAFGVLGCVNLITPYIAFPVCNIGALYAAFRIGRWYENCKCWGWQ